MKYTTLFAALVTLSACGGQAAKEGSSDTVAATVASAPSAATPVTDTVSIGGVLYDITPSTQAAFDAIVSWAPDTSEQHNIDKSAGLVTRTADTLFFTTENNRVVKLINNRNDDSDEFSVYGFLGEIPGTGQWLSSGSFYESFAYVLISKATGDTTFTIGLPTLSPDKQYIVCSNADLQAAFTPNGFGFYKNGKVPELVSETLIEDWGPEEVKWEDVNHLLVKKQVINRDADVDVYYIRLTARK